MLKWLRYAFGNKDGTWGDRNRSKPNSQSSTNWLALPPWDGSDKVRAVMAGWNSIVPYYRVDLDTYTCTCLDFVLERATLPNDDLCRCCKHILAFVLSSPEMCKRLRPHGYEVLSALSPHALPVSFESRQFRVADRTIFVIYKANTGYLQVLERTSASGYVEYGLSLDPRGDRWAHDNRPHNCVPIKQAIRPWSRMLDAKYATRQIEYRELLAEREVSVRRRLEEATYTQLPEWPLPNVIVRCWATKSKKVVINLNEYSCTCSKEKLDYQPKPRQLSQLCPHLLWAILEHLPKLVSWDAALIDAIRQFSAGRSFSQVVPG